MSPRIVEPRGVLWFGSAPVMEDGFFARPAEAPDGTRVVVRCGVLERIDLTGAYTVVEILEQAQRAGLEAVVEDIPDHAGRVLEAVGLEDAGASTA